ncbi:MAG: hypothetical protein ACE5HO_17945 [bacterium]
MSTLSSITLSELKSLLRSLKLPSDTKLSVTFEDEQANAEILKRKTAISAMKKLKGSGNGKLVSVLLKERQKDKLK